MLKSLKEFSLPAVEEKVLAYWRADDVFRKSLARTAGKERFVFYEGPPTANGRPGIHHVLARAFKDVVLRYKTMRGFYVPRRGGWDTHGLPVEIEVEKALGLKSKKEIEKYGIAAFNAKCKESVWKYKDEWERLTERMGFWLDMAHPYITYENRYMEAVWGMLSHIAKRKLLYKGHKVVPWCPRCGTGLSSHELALGYETVEDTSVYVKFKLKFGPEEIKGRFNSGDISILSWTTTPWTLPGNVALAINPNLEYVAVFTHRYGPPARYYILERNSLERLKKEIPDLDYTQVPQKIGNELLLGRSYEPLFEIDAFKSNKSDRSNKAYKVYPADFVTTEDGTGVVHTAVMYGEDDYQLGMKMGLPARHTVDEAGKFTKDVKGFAGMYVKAKETEEKILKHLQTANYLLQTAPYTHDYPFCWRCETPLLYYACDSWFIAMSRLRAKLLSENKKINWIPAHLREGRFGEWLREVKDWAISRSRYWGTPLPIWECRKCEATEVMGSIDELGARIGGRGNRFILIRHGFAESNLKNQVSGWPEKEKHHLTLEGHAEVENLRKDLAGRKVSAIYASPITRTKETAALLAHALGIEKVTYDPRLVEVNTGEFNGGHDSAYHRFFSSDVEKFTKRPPGGETLTELRARVWEFTRMINEKHRDETVVIVSHEYPLWMLEAALRGWNEEEAVIEKRARGGDFFRTGEAREVSFRAVPRDSTGKTDLHRPYVDAITFPCTKCSGTMRRVPEVLDVWFDSGAMPFAANESFAAQIENSKLSRLRRGLSVKSERIEKLTDYPADYITEGLDQTRGWFYTLLAIGVLMGKGCAYKNVYVQGILLDKFGKKMSKSKGNVVDPWLMISKYGIDAVRWFIYRGTRPGESVIFDEANVGKTFRQFILLVYHSYLFYEMYADKSELKTKNLKLKTAGILDRWILARLEETKEIATKALEKYEAGDAARAIEAFAGDLSRWYIRRSRRRLQPARRNLDAGGKPERDQDYRAASVTLGYVLIELSKLMAPFAPFFAEALYKSLVISHELSVHLENWPVVNKELITNNSKLIEAMEEVRRLASVGLAKRAEAGIKVRQPLASLKLKTNNRQLKTNKELLAILADEVNVKEAVVDPKLKEEVALDMKVTRGLLEEGWFRELVRTVQGMRQDAKLTPHDAIAVYAEVPPELVHVMRSREKEFSREVNAKSIEFTKTHKHNVELQTKIGDFPARLAVKKL